MSRRETWPTWVWCLVAVLAVLGIAATCWQERRCEEKGGTLLPRSNTCVRLERIP